MSPPSFSFVFLFHASISSSSCSCLPFFLLALIYSFSPEMGFINHCNAALGKMVLSAGRNTSPLTAPAGRKTLGLLLGFWRRVTDGICFLCLCACHRARAAGSVPHATWLLSVSAAAQAAPHMSNLLLYHPRTVSLCLHHCWFIINRPRSGWK